MADRALRGMQIGSKSLESEEGVVFAERFPVVYACTRGHEFEIMFANDAEPPSTWECRCGAVGDIVSDVKTGEDPKPAKQQRTHWDMLLERRSLEELATLLDEQLEAYRNGDLELDVAYRNG